MGKRVKKAPCSTQGATATTGEESSISAVSKLFLLITNLLIRESTDAILYPKSPFTSAGTFA